MVAVRITELTKTYKKHTVLQSVSLTIEGPGIWALVAPNGTGKTTLLNIMANLLKPTSGRVELLGKPNKNHRIFREVSYLQDNSVLFDYLTGYDHLKYVCDIHKLPPQRIAETAAYVGMESYLKKRVGSYSLGMKQHLLLAAAILPKPKLLLMDEPLNGLDPSSAILVRNILKELATAGTTIILSSHNLSEIDRVTRQVLFLKDGHLLEEDIAMHETVSYQLTMPHKETWEIHLESAGFSSSKTDYGYTVKLERNTFQDLLNLAYAHHVDIADIQKIRSGTEKRYAELFGVRESV